MRVLLTGGAGFIGAHLVEAILTATDWHVEVLDRLNYAGSLDRLSQFREHPRFRYVFHDFRAPFPKRLVEHFQGVDYVIHAGAETHVENSLHDPWAFVESNVLGTYHLLELARAVQPRRFVQVSTDEVFGPAPVGTDYREDARYSPSNPYSATKAGAESLVMAWATSFQVPVLLTRTMNNFGERQHPEKFVPMCIRNILRGNPVTIHASHGTIGSRKWLHARNHADAILFLLKHGAEGAYHIAGVERTNLEIAQTIFDAMGHDSQDAFAYELVDFHSSRPGHDLRYSLDDNKLRALGWDPPVPFQESMERAVRWTVKHPRWLDD